MRSQRFYKLQEDPEVHKGKGIEERGDSSPLDQKGAHVSHQLRSDETTIDT